MKKTKYYIYQITLDGNTEEVLVAKKDNRAFRHIIKSGSTAALKAVLHELSDENYERILNGAAPEDLRSENHADN